MNSRTDQQLLREYIGRRSEAAFAELVRRHVDFVYSAALRMVRNTHLAEDVSQSVFVALARSAGKLANHRALSGWLHRTARNMAANAVRSEVRRRTREQEAAAMNELLANEPDGLWKRIAPHLDAALGELREADRDALLLRYFERRSAREIAHTLGLSEVAAQKRVSRAVERLREFFVRRGVSVGASGLIVVISANAVQAAPVGLPVTISTAAALAGTPVATTATLTATMTTLQKTLAAAIVVAGVAIPLVVQHQARVKLREENQSLHQRVEELSGLVGRTRDTSALTMKRARPPGLVTAPMASTAPPGASPSRDADSKSAMAGIVQRYPHPPEVTVEQIESYLEENQRSAGSLMAGSRVTRDETLLEEAMERFPHDPQVNFAAVFKKEASPAHRRQWLEAFKQSAPDNALASYLSAGEFFKSGQIERAVQELSDASGKQQFQDYFMDFSQHEEETWSAAGYSPAEAKVYSAWSLGYPHLGELQHLSSDMVALATSYREAGDDSSAQAVLQMAVTMSQRLDESPGQPLPSRNVRLEIEKIALEAMDPTASCGREGQTVHDRLNELAQYQSVTADLEGRADQFELRQKVSERDWINYKDRWKTFGEEAALQWLVDKYGEK